MSNRKITDMVALTAPASDDVLPIVDISEAAAVDKNKKLIRIFDLPPVMRYDSFINKLDDKLDRMGHDYRIENMSQSKCDLIVSFKGMSIETFEETVENTHTHA